MQGRNGRRGAAIYASGGNSTVTFGFAERLLEKHINNPPKASGPVHDRSASNFVILPFKGQKQRQSKRQRQSKTFETFYRNESKNLIGFVNNRIGNWDDAADIVNDVFAYMYEHYRSKPAGELKAIAYNIAKKSVFGYFASPREQGRRNSMPWGEIDDESYDAGSVTPEAHVSDRQLLNLVIETISSMSERRQEILFLYRHEGLKYEEIAERLQTSKRTVCRELTEAMRQLKESVPV